MNRSRFDALEPDLLWHPWSSYYAERAARSARARLLRFAAALGLLLGSTALATWSVIALVVLTVGPAASP